MWNCGSTLIGHQPLNSHHNHKKICERLQNSAGSPLYAWISCEFPKTLRKGILKPNILGYVWATAITFLKETSECLNWLSWDPTTTITIKLSKAVFGGFSSFTRTVPLMQSVLFTYKGIPKNGKHQKLSSFQYISPLLISRKFPDLIFGNSQEISFGVRTKESFMKIVREHGSTDPIPGGEGLFTVSYL